MVDPSPEDDSMPEACADDEMDFDDLYGVPKASETPPKTPNGAQSKAGANVDDSHSKDPDVATDGATVAASEAPREKPTAKRKGRANLHVVDGSNSTDERRGRVEIRIDPDELDTNVKRILLALGSTGRVFKRDRFVVEIAGFIAKNPDEHKGPIATGAPVIVPIESPAMAVTIAENCVFRQLKFVDGEFRECRMQPPDALATKVCKQGPRGDELPTILGMLECPSMRPDGTVIIEQGIDPQTGYFLASDMILPPIPENPTLEHAQHELEKLKRLWSGGRGGKLGFFWANPEKDWIVPIAAFLGLVARPAIVPPMGGIPAFVFHGTTPGSQKGTIVDMICILATGRSAPISSWPTQKEEQEKEIGAIAMAGAPVAFWDEVQEVPGRILGNGRLHAALTADQTAFRVLGVSQMPVLPWRTVSFFAGTNFVLDPNMARRSLCAHLEAPCEKPGTLTPDQFVWADPRKEVFEHRAEYVAAALTILRAYHLAGRPKQGVIIGSFQPFADFVGGALKWAGAGNIADYIGTDPDMETTEDGGVRTVVREWARLPGVTEMTGLNIAAAISFLYPDERIKKIKSGEPVDFDGWDDLRGALESLAPLRAGIVKPEGEQIGKVFRGATKRWFDNARLVSVKNPVNGKPYNPAKWGVQKKAQPIAGAPTATEQAPTTDARIGTDQASMGGVQDAAEHDETTTSGPNGCPDVKCECTPCQRCGLCNWTPGELGGCICCVG